MVIDKPLTAASRRRIRVLLVRQGLERLAAELLRAAEGGDAAERKHSYVSSRLRLLAAEACGAEWRRLMDIARRAGMVYGETSAVLHSNRAFGDVPEVLVTEWEEVVATLRVAVTEKLESMSAEGITP